MITNGYIHIQVNNAGIYTDKRWFSKNKEILTSENRSMTRYILKSQVGGLSFWSPVILYKLKTQQKSKCKERWPYKGASVLCSKI